MSATFTTSDNTQLTCYGKVQEIVQVRMLHSDPQLFLKVDWYKPSLVGACPSIEGRTRIRCNGLASHDKDRSKSFIRADKVDSQVFFVPIPAQHAYMNKTTWVWVCEDVASSYTLPQHLLDDYGDDAAALED